MNTLLKGVTMFMWMGVVVFSGASFALAMMGSKDSLLFAMYLCAAGIATFLNVVMWPAMYTRDGKTDAGQIAISAAMHLIWAAGFGSIIALVNMS